jgi:hypothetical protein
VARWGERGEVHESAGMRPRMENGIPAGPNANTALQEANVASMHVTLRVLAASQTGMDLKQLRACKQIVETKKACADEWIRGGH